MDKSSKFRKVEPMRGPGKKRDQQNIDRERMAQEMIQAERVAQSGAMKQQKGGDNRMQQPPTKEQGKNVMAGGMDMAQDDFEFEVKNKQTLSLQLLKEGYSQSYIDFFYITHHTMPEVIQPSEACVEEMEKNKSKKKPTFETTEDLERLQDLLKSGENCLRSDDKEGAIEEYQKLAKFFYENPDVCDYQTSAYFYKRMNSIAKSMGDQYTFECRAMIGLGNCYSSLDRLEKAISLYEDVLAKADHFQLQGIVKDVSKQLIQIYRKMAAACENNEDESEQALLYLEKCLEAAEKGQEEEQKGLICHKIGGIYSKKQEHEKALQYQEKNLKIAEKQDGKERKNVTNLIEAHAAVAKTNMALQKYDEAQKHLEEYFKISKESLKKNANADAAYHLARLYAIKGETKKSIDNYQIHFESARNEKHNKDRKLIDKARVFLGIAKANNNVDGFIKIVKNSTKDIRPLLEWKTKKEK